MTQLEELLYSLATVIIRYHDSQNVEKKIIQTEVEHAHKARIFATRLINDDTKDFASQLRQYSKNCTIDYKLRHDFLLYLVNEIIFLNQQLHRERPYSDEEIALFETQITELLIDCYKLLCTNKSEFSEVTYHPQYESQESRIFRLNGFIDNGYTMNTKCRSLKLLRDEVFGSLLSLDKHKHVDDKSLVLKLAKKICDEHQQQLIVKTISSLETANKNLRYDLQTRDEEIVSLSSKLKKMEITCNAQQETIENHCEITAKQDCTITEQIKTIADLQKEITQLNKVISGLQAQNKKAMLVNQVPKELHKEHKKREMSGGSLGTLFGIPTDRYFHLEEETKSRGYDIDATPGMGW